MEERFATEDNVEIVIRSDADRAEAHCAIDLCRIPSKVRITPPRASDELTSRMHCAIRCVSKQLMWADEHLTEEEWKLLFVAAHFGQRVVPSPDGNRFIVLQKQTRNMSGAQKHELTEMIYEFGASRGVVFDEGDSNE